MLSSRDYPSTRKKRLGKAWSFGCLTSLGKEEALPRRLMGNNKNRRQISRQARVSICKREGLKICDEQKAPVASWWQLSFSTIGQVARGETQCPELDTCALS